MSDIAMNRQITEFRQKLVREGAVYFFFDPTEDDKAAARAGKGLIQGTPGSGLYRRNEGIYELRLEYSPYQEWNTERWSQYLQTNEPRARYLSHKRQYGKCEQTISKQFDHLIVRFALE